MNLSFFDGVCAHAVMGGWGCCTPHLPSVVRAAQRHYVVLPVLRGAAAAAAPIWAARRRRCASLLGPIANLLVACCPRPLQAEEDALDAPVRSPLRSPVRSPRRSSPLRSPARFPRGGASSLIDYLPGGGGGGKVGGGGGGSGDGKGGGGDSPSRWGAAVRELRRNKTLPGIPL